MTKGDHTLEKVKVEKLEQISRDSYILEFERFFDFEPGQVIKLAEGEGVDPRLYSIASGNRDQNVQILFNKVDDGQLTPRLIDLKAGDQIFASAGFGKFTGILEDAWWIAQGTGLAPFLSMYRSGMADKKILVHGGKYADSFYFQDELKQVFGEKYVRCCTRETGTGLFNGRVTDYLEMVPELPEETLYYLCGSSEMVVQTRDILIKRGISFTRVVSEIYF